MLVQPRVKCSTKNLSQGEKIFKKKIFKNTINTKLKFLNYLSKDSNDLQSIVEKKYPILRELLEYIKNERDAIFQELQALGQFVTVYLKNEMTQRALYNLKIKYPKFWASLAKTV